MGATLEINLEQTQTGIGLHYTRFADDQRKILKFVCVSGLPKPAEANSNNSEFLRRYGQPQKALLVLLLRAYGSGFMKPSLDSYEEPALARSLANICYKQMSPCDTSKWLYTVVGISTAGKLEDWFAVSGNTSTNRTCRVVLPQTWKDVELLVRVGGAADFTPLDEYQALARAIAHRQPPPPPSSKPIIKHFEILVWNSALACFGRGFNTVRSGDRVQLQVQIDQPAFIYLLWADSQGNVATLYPWSGSNWEWKGEPQKTNCLIIPDHSFAENPLSLQVEGTLGTEHVLVLVDRRTPEIKAMRLLRKLLVGSELLKRCPRPELPVMAQFAGQSTQRNAVRMVHRLTVDPGVKSFQSRLAEVLTPHFDDTLICTFFNEGKTVSTQ